MSYPYIGTRAAVSCTRATVILRPDASAIVRIGQHRTLASLQNDIALTPPNGGSNLRNELTLRPIRQRSLEAIDPLCCVAKEPGEDPKQYWKYRAYLPHYTESLSKLKKITGDNRLSC